MAGVQAGTAYIPVKPDLSSFGKDVKRQTSGAMGSIKSFAKNAAIALGGAFAVSKGIDFLKGSIDAASELNETVSKSRTIFGPAADDLEKWASGAAKAIGQSKQQALDAAATFGNLFVQLGIGSDEASKMSQEMVTLASDFASFHNADPTAVIEAQTAAFRGEYDALQRFVPTINAAAVEQEALAMTGKTATKELTLQEKALATQSLMMKGAGDATGDFARTSDSLANKQRIASAQWADMTTKIGQQLLPAMNAVVGFISTSVIPALGSLGSWVGSLSPYFESFRQVVERAIGVVTGLFKRSESDVGGSASKLSQIVAQLSELFSTYFEYIRTVVSTAVKVITDLWDRFGADLLKYARRTFDNILKLISGVLTAIQGAFDLFIGIFTGDWSRAWDGVKAIFSGAWTAIRAVLDQALNAINTAIQIALGLVSAAWSLAWNSMQTLLGDVWEGIKSSLSSALTTVTDWFGDLPDRLWAAVELGVGTLQSLGKFMVQKMLEGIKFLADADAGFKGWIMGLPDQLWTWIGNVAEKVKSIGKKIVEKIIEGVASMAGSLASAVKNAIPGAGVVGDVLGNIPGIGGDGPGAVPPGGGRGSAGGMARNAIARFGGRITSTYRSPAHNRRVGGSPTSYHIDRRNPAHDIVGPNMRGMFDYLWRTYGGSIREMIYGNRMVKNGRMVPYRRNDHWDHVHVAHSGGHVTPQGIEPLRADELLTKLQVGETVLPRDFAGAGSELPDMSYWDEAGRRQARAYRSEMRLLTRQG